jgi:hypothetical protein
VPSNPERGLLDTSTFIHSERVASPGDSLPAQVCLSAITLAELSLGPLLVDDPAERARRQQHVQLAAEVEMLPFDAACAQMFAPIAATKATTAQRERVRDSY